MLFVPALRSSINLINRSLASARMMYQVAASEHSAGLANYENLINTARFIRDYFPPMHAEGPRFIDRAALNAFANISTEELRATRETLATHLHIPDPFGPLHFE